MASLRTVIVIACYIIDKYEGFVPPARNAARNSVTETLDYLKRNPTPQFDIYWWTLADEIIEFFRTLKTRPEYAVIKQQKDAMEYESCIQICCTADRNDVSVLDFALAVMMPHLYAKLKPKEPILLDPLVSEAKLYEQGHYIGTLGTAERFFMKLTKVEDEDRTSGGNLFVLQDRAGNMGVFYDKADRWNECIQLGSCFHFHAIPCRHTTLSPDLPVTMFRNVEFIESAGIAAALPPIGNDRTAKGLFTKGRTEIPL